ncbi:MAG: hypothetical protein OK456_08725 [Thaumarchaeota archaeon]|nr:hypothetical protein [Nitrososphaerota archaeon]
MRKVVLALLGLLSIFILPSGIYLPAHAQSGTLYGCTTGVGAGPGPSSLYTINPGTGAATLIGAMGVNQCSGLDFVGGVLYAGAKSGGQDALFTVNTATGAATLVGISTNLNCGPPITDLATDPLTHVLYGTMFDCVVTFNLNTGATTFIGDTAGDTDGNGLAFTPGGQLYYADDQHLFTVNSMTAASTVVAVMTGQPGGCTHEAIDAMKFDSSGTLWGVLVCADGGLQNWLVTMNPATAVITPIGLTGAHMDGIAWAGVPLTPPGPLPPVISKTLLFTFSSFSGSAPAPIVGKLVGVEGSAILYNLPGYQVTAGVYPYSNSVCYISSQNLVSISGFSDYQAGFNSTEVLVHDYYNVESNAQGWPAEPACAS